MESLESRLALDATVLGTSEVDHFRVGPGPTANSIMVSSANGTFASRVFTNLTGTLTLVPFGGEDTITIDPLGSRFTGNVIVNDTGAVTLRNISLTGTLTVNASTITAADGSSIVSTQGDVELNAKSESSFTFPLSQVGFKNRENVSRITIGSARISGKNVELNSYAGATRTARAEYNQDTRVVSLGDVNGDNRPDLLVANSDAGTGGGLGGSLLLFLNSGRSDPFDGSVPITLTRGGAMTSLAIADVNGDARPDLVVGSSANPDLPGTAIFSRLFLNTGLADLPFRDVAGSVFNVGTGRDFTNAVSVADLNGDRRPDLVLGNGVGINAGGVATPSASRIIFNQGGANPFVGTGVTIGLGTANTRDVELVDLNQDGRIDLLMGNAAYVTGQAPNTTRVASPSRVFLNQGGATPFTGNGLVLAGTADDGITCVAVGDLNADGRPDIVLGNDGKPSRVYFSTASTFAHAASSVPLGRVESTKGIAIVDANNDGRLDIVQANAGVSRIYVNGNGPVRFSQVVDLGSDGFSSQSTVAIAVADLTGDGRSDLVMGSKGAPPQIFVNDGTSRPFVDSNIKVVSRDPSLANTVDIPLLDQFNVFASVVKAKATSSIHVATGAVINASQDVVIGSTALADARNTTVGMFLGITHGSAEPTSTVTLASGARVSAAGIFDLQSKANALLDVSVITVAPALFNIDVAYGRANAVSNATLESGSRVAAGRVNIAATNTNSLSTSASGFNLSLGGPVAGGLGIAISDYDSSATTYVNGLVNVTGTDLLIDARSVNVEDSTIGTASVIGVADIMGTLRSIVKGVGNLLKDSAKSAATLKGTPQQGNLVRLLTAAPGDFSSVSLAAGIAVADSNNAAEARVGGDAVINARRNLRVNSRAEDNFKVIATGDSSGSSTAAFGGGVAVSTLVNSANSSLDSGSDVVVGGLTHIVSNAVYPNPVNSAIPGFRFVPPADTTNTPSSNDADRIANGFQMGQALADDFLTYVVQTVVPVVKGVLLGNPSDVGTSFVKGTGATAAGGKLGIGGGVNIIRIDNNSVAQIGKNAKVNQRPTAVAPTNQDVWVEADTTIITMNFGNQASLLNVPSAGAGAGGAVGIGGQFEYIGYTNSGRAFIDDGARVSAGRDIQVTADTFNYLLTVAQAGADAGKVGVGGTVVFHELRNETLAYAEDGAVLNAGRNLKILAGNQLQVFNAGGGITTGSTFGAGVSLAVNLLQQNDTWAFIGDKNGVLAIGSVRAGRNMDVKAAADTTVVGLAISGSAADGLPNALDRPKGPDAFSSFDDWEKALLEYDISLRPKGGVAVAGDAGVNGLVSDTRAFISGVSNLTVGNELTVAANDTGLFAAAAGAVAYANSTGIGGSLALNSIRRNTVALVERTPVTAGSVSITANSVETPVTVAVGAGVAIEDAAVAGSITFSDVVSDVRALVGANSPITTNRVGNATIPAGGVTVDAKRDSKSYSVAGVASASINGIAAVGLAVDVALQDGEVLANIASQVDSIGSVRVFAADGQTNFGVAAGISASPKDGAGVSGSATFSRSNQVARATIAPNTNVTSVGSVRLDADGKLKNVRVAGAVGGGKRAGVGGAFTINLVPDRVVQAAVGNNAVVTGRGNGPAVADPQDVNSTATGVVIDAQANDDFLHFAAAGGVSPGQLGLAGSAVGSSVSNSLTEAVIRRGAIINQGGAAATQDVMIHANHDTRALSVAGSIAGAKTAGVGAAVVVEEIDRNIYATVERDTLVRAARFATIDAHSSLPLTTVAGAIAGGADAALAGSVVVQTLNTDTLATFGQNGANTRATLVAGAARVWADSQSEQLSISGVAAGSGRAGIGASNVTNIQTNQTLASLAVGSQVTLSGIEGLTAPTGYRDEDGALKFRPVVGMAVVATSEEDITPIAAGAAGGKVGVAGSVTVTTLDATTLGTIGEGSVLRTPFSLIASSETNVEGGGGSAAGGLYAGVGAGVDVQTVKKRVQATLASSLNAITTVAPAIQGDVIVRALSNGDQLSVSAALAASGYAGVAGGASGIRIDNATKATIGSHARVTANGNVLVTAEDTTSATGIAGSVGAGQAAGVGASVGVAIVNKNTEALIQSKAVVTANPVGNIPTRATEIANGDFEIVEVVAVGGLFDARSGVNAQNQTIKLDAPHRFTAGAGQAVQYSDGGGVALGGLVDGRTYYVIVVDATTVRLATTAERARAGQADVFPVATTSIVPNSLTPVGQGPLPVRNGPDNLINSQVSNILDRRGLAPSRTQVQGVAVTAVNLDRIESYAAAAGTGMVTVPISAAVDIVDANVNARIDDSASITGIDVLVAAGSELLHLGVGGAVGAGGAASVAPGIQVPIVTLETHASVGNLVTIIASDDVDVIAKSNQDVLSIAMGLVNGGRVTVGGSVGVLTLTSDTIAETGTNSVIEAGGNVGIQSYNVTDAVVITGAGASGGAGGLGGSVAVIYLDKETRATVGNNSVINAKGDSLSTLFGFDSINPRGRSVNGLLVQAIGTQELFGVAAAGAVGAIGGLAGAVTVTTTNTQTTAEVGDRARINQVAAQGAVLIQDVVIYAGDNTTTQAAAGALGGAGLLGGISGGLAGGVDVGLITPNVEARVGTGAVLRAARDVVVAGQSFTNARSFAASAAAGSIGVAGAVSVYGLGSPLTTDARTSLKANDQGNTATAGSYVDDVAKAQQVTGLLGQYQVSANSSEADKRAVQFLNQSNDALLTSLPSGRASVAIASNGQASTKTTIAPSSSIIAGAKATIAGRDRVNLLQNTGTIAGGAAAFGGAVGIASSAHQVAVQVDGNITAVGDVAILSTYDALMDGGAGAGLGTSNGVTVGLIGIGAQVSRFQDLSSNTASLGGAVNRADTLRIEALQTRSLNANAQGVTAGGVVVGVASAHANLAGSNSATITGQVGQAARQAVNNLVLSSTATNYATSKTKAVAGGVLSGAGSDAQATHTGDKPDSNGVFLNGAKVKVANDVTLVGLAQQQASALADGRNVGGVTVGVSQTKTDVDSGGRIRLAGGTVLVAGRDVTMNASGQAVVDAKALAVGGGLVSGNAADVAINATPKSELRLVNDGGAIQINAGRDLSLLSETGHTYTGAADSQAYGFVGTGKTQAIGSFGQVTLLDVSAGSLLNAGRNMNVRADARSTATFKVGRNVEQILGTGLSAIGGSSPASAVAASGSQTSVTFGAGATLTAAEQLNLASTTFVAPKLQSSAAIGGLFSPAKSSSATSNTIMVSQLSLGDAVFTGQSVTALASGTALVTNRASGSNSILTGGDVLQQSDILTNQAIVSSTAGGLIQARTWTPTARTNATADGTTNRSQRTTIDVLNQIPRVDIKGRVQPR